MKSDELALLLHTGRYDRLENGELKIGYTAIDPADKYVTYNCGKPDCWTKDLRPIRGRIFRVIKGLTLLFYIAASACCSSRYLRCTRFGTRVLKSRSL